LQEACPELPILGAASAEDTYQIAKFLTNGMRSYVVRDAAKDYMFLIHAALNAVVEAMKREKEQMIARQLRQEIDSVRRLQQSILPDSIINPPGYHILGRYEPAQIRVLGGVPVTLAGGDYYNAYALNKETVILIVGDASGHGIKACMSIMTMHTLIGMMSGEKFLNTSKFVGKVNQQLNNQKIVNGDGGFITMLYGVLNTRKHTFEWTSAGHPQPMLIEQKSGQILDLSEMETSGMPLAIDEDATYKQHKITIPPHSRLLLYTDGIVEAFNPQNAADKGFGVQGLKAIMKESIEAPIGELMDQLFEKSLAHTFGAGRHDDTSVLCIERI
jgi:serine phosphatase RsbU (regulator of sigma subunit)